MRQNTGQLRQILRWIIIFLILLDGLLIALWIFRLPGSNRNELAIGEFAKVETVSVGIQAPVELDWKTKGEVLQLRTSAVQEHPELMASGYKPDERIFGKIVDSLPWWGMQGQFFYGDGEKSIAGPSEESRFILNPFLLVGASFYNWWHGRLSEADLSSYPMTCLPRDLQWRPREGRAEVRYDAGCIKTIGSKHFDLIAYNARDLNLSYIFVSYQDSQNIYKQDIPTTAYANPQFIHQGGSCGYPGGCNNMSPYTPEIDELEITGFPAKLVIWLWKSEPASLKQKPDMVFILNFR
jgi:hypothetical protein